MALWTTIASWVLVAAVAVAAHLFGREARSAPESDARHRAAVQRRSQIGVAVSITGPLLAFLAGLLTAAATGRWTTIGLATVVGITAISAIGLFLAPH